MKTIYLFFLIAVAFVHLHAQNCTNGNYTLPGVYPSDTLQGLKKACVNENYSETITIVVSASETVNGVTYQVASLKVNSLTGLPSGITYSCNPLNCTIAGGAKGCIGISGKAATAGAYPLTASVTLTIRVSFFIIPFDTSVVIGELVVQPKDCAGICGGTSKHQTIALAAGWNIISSYIIPPNPSIPAIFADIKNDIIMVKNNAGATYLPSLNINTIPSWNATQGYSVKTFRTATLNMGCGQSAPTVVPLVVGWNLIPFTKETPKSISAVFSGLENDVMIVKNNSGGAFIPSLNINTIGDLKPGQGYQVKMSKAHNLLY